MAGAEALKSLYLQMNMFLPSSYQISRDQVLRALDRQPPHSRHGHGSHGSRPLNPPPPPPAKNNCDTSMGQQQQQHQHPAMVAGHAAAAAVVEGQGALGGDTSTQLPAGTTLPPLPLPSFSTSSSSSSSSSEDAVQVVRLAPEQERVLALLQGGRSVFFTGCGGASLLLFLLRLPLFLLLQPAITRHPQTV
eukprot:COSAG05_NODE_1543_length_4591_cov_1.921416_4_plen_191_part_00